MLLIPRERIIDPDWSFHSVTIKIKLIENFDFKYFILMISRKSLFLFDFLDKVFNFSLNKLKLKTSGSGFCVSSVVFKIELSVECALHLSKFMHYAVRPKCVYASKVTQTLTPTGPPQDVDVLVLKNCRPRTSSSPS